MENEDVLKVENLSVSLEDRSILSGINFSVKKGEALVVIGPNGAGKSVLFKALLGLVPFSGNISWGKDIALGYIPQKLAIEADTPLTAKEFFQLKCSHFWTIPKEFAGHFDHELALVGLTKKVLNQNVSALSGGEFQRLLIAWAMINHPDVLLFDEPTSGIDVGFEETVYNILRKVQQERGTTVLIISHDLNVVYKYADNVLCLNRKMICSGPPSSVLTAEKLNKVYGESSFHHH